ncbi:MAG: phosphoribosylglycinamide formyltransferase [Calditrichaeota bacterium]|nr:MAG: phosphoribosylglycinamide formyltransferase [Calditrichota bacterium]
MKIAVFGSGRGSNFEALLRAKIPNADFSLVISNKKDARILELGSENGIKTKAFKSSEFSEENENIVLDFLLENGIELIVLAGFLRKISATIIQKYSNKIINIHPALLPSFGGIGMYGKYIHEAVLKSGTQFSGPTVHFVNENYDEGPIILQETVPVLFEDSTDDLAKRVLEVEHRIFAKALDLVINGKFEIKGKRVKFC